ncbi:hypothetical protein [Streptomyces sp. NPDC003077]|uniref:hypothetical protein n=1 Tax=Streptomyces sp. NPDC003077 TaxID=3154443 RepID=UPI0033A6133A
MTGALGVALAVALAGCGGGTEDPDAGTNGVGKLSAAKIEAKARAAADSAGTVRLLGSVVSQGRTYKLDMRLAADGGRGEVSSEAATFQLLRVGQALYLKADAGFWAREKDDRPTAGGTAAPSGRATGTSTAASKLDGKYVKVPASDPVYKRFRGFTDKDVLLSSLLGLRGELTTGDRGTFDGTRTIRLSAGRGAGGTLDVSLEGKPYPLRLQRAGGGGVVQLTDWGGSVDLRVPDAAQVVDYGQQVGTGSGTGTGPGGDSSPGGASSPGGS